MKGSVVAAHEKAGVMPKRSESKCKPGGGYCKEASKRFPHLTDGSNRGFKAENGSYTMDSIFNSLGENKGALHNVGKAISEISKHVPKDDEKPWFKQVV